MLLCFFDVRFHVLNITQTGALSKNQCYAVAVLKKWGYV
jgi:hypothetical protein